MSTTFGETTTDGHTETIEHHRLRPGQRLLIGGALTASAADLGWMAAVGEVVPPMVGFAVLVALSVVLLRARARRQAGVLGALAALFLAVGGRFVVGELGHPTDLAAFSWAVLTGGGRLVTLAAAAMLWRGSTRLARPLGLTAGVAGVVLVGFSAVSAASVSSDARRPGDVEVPAVDSTFPDTVSVASGGTLFVENQDRLRHTFTISGTAIDENLPPGIDRRVDVDLEPGTYAIRCTVHGHETMTGTLIVD